MCALAAGCGGDDDDDTSSVDGGASVDSAVTMPDSSTMAANNTVEAATAVGMRPTAAGMVMLRYASDPAGGPKADHGGQSGSVTVDLVGGKLHAVATGIPSKELTSMATGTIAGNLTCP